jgi:D-threo-aldose 1-dehydrogenase
MRELGSRRRLGSSSVEVGPLGLGVAPLGNLYSEVNDTDAHATLAKAEEVGVRWLDVAPLYGLGLAEERLGTYLRQASKVPRIMSTKVGRVLRPVSSRPTHAQFVSTLSNVAGFDYSRLGIERSYQQSLERLGVDRVQILLLHDVDRTTHGTSHRQLVKQLLDESLPTLHRLKAEGRVDAIGIGVNSWEVGFEILASAQIDCVLLAGRYTLLDHSAFTSGFLDACGRRRVSVMAGGVFNSGFLAGGAYYDYRPADAAMFERRAKLERLCERHGVKLGHAAIQFAAGHSAVTSVVIGARSVQEVSDMVEVFRTNVPSDLWSELRDADLIPRDFER